MDQLSLPDTFYCFPRKNLLWSHSSPIERLDNIEKHVGKNVQVWIKRDDCNSGLAFGGNKLRALEYIFPDILERGCDIVVAEGGVQSNTVRQVAAAAAKIGLESLLVQRPGSVSWKEPTSEAYHRLGNVQITKLISPRYTQGHVEDVLADLVAAGRKPYHIPAGTSGIPLGGIGYARLAYEIIEQEKTHDVFFDTIILPSAGGTTAGGILAGFRLAELNNPTGCRGRKPRKIVSVFVGSDSWSLEKPLHESARTTMKLLDPKHEADVKLDSEFVHLEMEFSYNAGGYGLIDDATIKAMKLAGTLEGLVLDPVYTGKAFACMLERIKNGLIASGTCALFLHTGGATVLSAYADLSPNA